MRGFNSELNPRAGQWITNSSRTIRSQIFFYRNPKFEDSMFKNRDQTDGRIGLMNSTEKIFSEIGSNNVTSRQIDNDLIENWNGWFSTKSTEKGRWYYNIKRQ
jgi:hypothetical protein